METDTSSLSVWPKGQKQQQQNTPQIRCTGRELVYSWNRSPSLSLFIKREVYAYVFRRCEIVGPISAGHQYDNVMRTKPSACYRLFVVLSGQLPSARRRSDRQNSSGPMTTAVHGPTGTAISTRDRPDKSMLLW